MTYRGPNASRIGAQLTTIAQYHAETATWHALVSAETANTSAYLAGAGTTEHWRDTTISGLFAFSRLSPLPKEFQTLGGMIQAGDVTLSTFQKLNNRDIIIWNGVRYTVEGDSVAVRFGDRVWYRTVLCRGDNA